MKNIYKNTFSLIILLITPFLLTSQTNSIAIENIIKDYKENEANPGTEFTIKRIDLDNDNDLDYIFSFGCGEQNCLRIHLNKKGTYEKVVNEFGSESFYITDSKNGKTSQLVLNAVTNHCCGESPFGSYRDFVFANDQAIVKNNYVIYNHQYYNDEDNYRLTLVPETFLDKPYQASITTNGYNVRFSADLDTHNAMFTCSEETNIIARITEGKEVTVIAEYRGNDYEERTWLYVEIPTEAMYEDECPSPISYGFENQKLRGWISNKYIQRK